LEITTAMVKELRQATGAGVLDCRKALETHDGDMEKAVAYLREKGLAAAAKKAGRQASEGVVEAYVHPGSRVAVMLELNCETDFVARTADFKTLAHDLALHIAFAAPRYISRADVPQEVVESERGRSIAPRRWQRANPSTSWIASSRDGWRNSISKYA